MPTDTPNRDQIFDLKSGTTDPDAVLGYYDDWAATYDETLVTWDYRAPTDAAARLAPHVSDGDTILDVGCGTGLFAEAMAPHGAFRMVGLDISPESLRLAKERDLYGALTAHDLQRLPLPVADNAVDAAASVGVLTYLDAADDLLRDLCRCVKSGGVITFTQRTDRWDELDFRKVVEAIAEEARWHILDISGPQDYLPGNADFGQDIKIIHTVCRVA